MTSFTRNLPWFIQDLGVSIVGQVSPFTSVPVSWTTEKRVLGVLHVTDRGAEYRRCGMPQVFRFKRSGYRHSGWWGDYESTPNCSQ